MKFQKSFNLYWSVFYRVHQKFPVRFPWNWVFVLLLAPKIKIKDVSSWFLAWGRFLGSRDRAFGDFDFTTDRQIILPLGLEKKWSRDDGDLNDAREGINCQRKKKRRRYTVIISIERFYTEEKILKILKISWRNIWGILSERQRKILKRRKSGIIIIEI